MKTVGKAVLSGALAIAAAGAMLFLPAGTFDYWQAWVFLAVFALATWIPTVYLVRNNPAALDRRLRVGPLRETRMLQKVISSIAFLLLAAIMVFSVLDHRFGWSPVPPAVSLVGDVLVALGLGLAILVVIQNACAGTTITVETEQKLVSTGLYGLVRHPMYTGNVIVMVGIPLALDSYWGLVFVIPGLVIYSLRIRDEEDLLTQKLNGYREYVQQVQYRLAPYVW
jgi:protein-S-isoprenylcysteine O-methyltransferase Ste14